MIITGNLGLVKKINKYTVLNIIRNKKMISRAQIAKVAGLNKATVSSLVDELIAEDLVFESGTGVSTGGRRPLMLKFNVEAGSLVGVDLGVDYIYVVLTNLNAKILWEKRVSFKTNKTAQDSIVEQMVQLIEEAINYAEDTPHGVMGIGIGVPGIVNTEKGTILIAPNLYWDNVSFTSILKEHFPDYYLTVENDAKLAALGEKWFGAGRKYSNLVYITASTGIGAGIILNDQLYSGIEGLAGEIGHNTIEVNGFKCSCGNYGCWEMYASEKYIRYRLEAVNRSAELENFSIDHLCTLANQGDKEIQEILFEVGTYLGVGIVNIINSYNPEAVIIGSALGRAGEWVLDPAKKVVHDRLLIKNSNYPFITNSELDEKSCVIGAVSSSLERILNP
jgi:glucokinase-like ROK family protein